MPRTAVTVQTPKGPNVGAFTSNLCDITFTAADVANKNSAVFQGNRMLVVIKNDDAGSVSWTITSKANPSGRTGDIVDPTFETGKVAMFIVERDGFQQEADNSLHFEASDADCKFAILAIP